MELKYPTCPFFLPTASPLPATLELDNGTAARWILELVAMVLALTWLCVPRLRSFPPILHVLVQNESKAMYVLLSTVHCSL